jgi:hypothetical protein
MVGWVKTMVTEDRLDTLVQKLYMRPDEHAVYMVPEWPH